MKVRVAVIHPSNSVDELIRVKVLFEENRQHNGKPLATEAASVDIYIEPTDSFAELQERAFKTAREFLSKAVTLGTQ